MDFFGNTESLLAQVEESAEPLRRKRKVVLMMMAATVIAVAQTLMFFPSLGFLSPQNACRSLLCREDEDGGEVDRALHALMHSMTRAMGKVVEELEECESEEDESDEDE